MLRLYEKNKLTFALIMIAIYVVVCSAADSISDSLGFYKGVTAPALLIFSVLVFLFLRRNHLCTEFGLCKFQGNPAHYLFFIPLAVLVSVNLWGGAALGNTDALGIVMHIISMLCVGFLEELIFRGFLFKAMLDDNVTTAIIVSSITFAIGHAVNLLNGADLFATLLQICYAAATGLVFTLIFYRGKSLIPCIVTHGIFNALSIFAVEGTRDFQIITAAAMCVICLAYALLIWKNTKSETEKIPDNEA